MIYLTLLNIYTHRSMISLNTNTATYPTGSRYEYDETVVASHVKKGYSFVIGELGRWNL